MLRSSSSNHTGKPRKRGIGIERLEAHRITNAALKQKQKSAMIYANRVQKPIIQEQAINNFDTLYGISNNNCSQMQQPCIIPMMENRIPAFHRLGQHHMVPSSSNKTIEEFWLKNRQPSFSGVHQHPMDLASNQSHVSNVSFPTESTDEIKVIKRWSPSSHPTKQSHFSSSYITPKLVKEENLVAGIKRPYPFNRANPDKLVSKYGDGLPESESKSNAFRKRTSSSSNNQNGDDKSLDENCVAAEVEILTLDPILLPSKHPLFTKCCKPTLLTCQESTKESLFYDFMGPSEKTLDEMRKEPLGCLDLNLKL